MADVPFQFRATRDKKMRLDEAASEPQVGGEDKMDCGDPERDTGFVFTVCPVIGASLTGSDSASLCPTWLAASSGRLLSKSVRTRTNVPYLCDCIGPPHELIFDFSLVITASRVHRKTMGR
jgi:hypothetical protein